MPSFFSYARMWCPEKAALSKCDEGTTFAALRWHELFSGHTPDSFHPSLFNISGLLKEVQLIGQRIPQHAAWQKHLLYVRDELASRTSELELGCLNLQQKQMISRICSKQTTDIDAIGLARVLLLDGIEDGIDTAISRRVAELNLQECRKKKEACDNILQHAATVAYRRGGVSLGDADLQRALEGGEAGVRQLFDFNELFQQGEFECVVGVQGVTGQQLNDLRKVCDHGNSPSRINKSGTRIQGLPQQNEIPEHLRAGWLSSKVVAGNAAKAVEQFKERVRNALNVISLFYQRPAASLHPGGWIIKNGNARPVSSRDESLKNHHPRQRALELANLAVKNLSCVSEPSIFAALDLHNAALSTSDHRFRLVNLWSALECLTAVLEGDSIISKVLRVAPPLLAWRNIDKHVRYLAISLHQWIKSNPGLNLGDLPFSLSYSQNVPPERLLEALALPHGSKSLIQLGAFTADHPLLKFRLKKAQQHFSSPKTVRLHMDRSQQRLQWHLYRIYRARNLLVHEGTAVESLPQMADHLQHYVSWLTGRMIQALGRGSQWKLRDAWNYWLARADYVHKSLSGRNDENLHFGLQMQDVFTGKLLDPNKSIWGAPLAGKDVAEGNSRPD